MQNLRSPIVGIIKYSVLSTRDRHQYVSSNEKTWEEHVASVMNPKRLAFRFRILSEIILPQLADQTLAPEKSWFSLIIVTSQDLPSQIKSDLYEAAKPYPWVRIVERGIDDWFDAPALVRDSLLRMSFQGSDVPFLSFRLDDDDVLSLTYLERAQRYVASPNVDKFLTFSHGAKILWSATHFAVRNYKDEIRPFIAIGLAAISSFNFQRKDFNSKVKTVFIGVNHYDIRNTESFIEDRSSNMFLWSQNFSQDTHGRFKSVEFAGEWHAPLPEISAKLEGYPHVLKFVV